MKLSSVPFILKGGKKEKEGGKTYLQGTQAALYKKEEEEKREERENKKEDAVLF